MSACGGGGGGGYTPNSPGPVIYYTTPVQQATIDPMTGADTAANFLGNTFVEDIDGDGYADDFIVAGRKTQPTTADAWNNTKLSMMSFENGQLVDKTAQWFSGTDNEIIGTEPNVHFADFFKTGRKDMFISHSTDMRYYGPATFFTNNGTNFTKVSIPTQGIWSHGSDVGDLNNDTYVDIIMTDYGPGTTIALNNQVNGFTTYVDPLGLSGDNRYGGSAVTIGNFMNNGGNNEIIQTDSTCSPSMPHGTGCSTSKTKMFSVDFTGGVLKYTFIKDLPVAANSANSDHHVQVVNHDYNEDGNADIIVFSRTSANNYETELSEIQFLQNDGSGNFTDTTTSTLVGYKTDTSSTYQPRFFDINGDGKIDILVSGQEFELNDGNGQGADSHQFLIKTSDNKYVAAYQNILKNFLGDVASISGNTVDSSTVNIFQGDDGNKYLVTWASTTSSVDNKLTFFMSKLNTNAIAAGTAIDMIQNAWPYLSDAQAAQALADTGQSFAGGTIINMNKAFDPIGTLTMSGLELNGGVWGFDIGNTTGTAMDGIGRGYNVNLAQTNIQTNGATMYNAVDAFNTVKDGKTTFGADDETQQFTFGHALYQDNTTTYSVHMTKLNSNPWIGFSGVWGEVTGANIMDNVVTYKAGNFTAKGSVMHVSTNFNSGLITEVSNQIGIWGDVSYAKGGFKIDAGVHPVLLDGSVKATIPTSVNMKGNLNYTNHEYALPTLVNGYLKTNYNINLDKNNSKLQFSSAVSQTGLLNTQINYYYNW